MADFYKHFTDTEPRAPSSEELQVLAAKLGSDEGRVRQEAREKLEQAGKEAVPYLVSALGDLGSAHRRWEAAKALDHLRDPSTATALVHALMDEEADIRWLAADALANLGYWCEDALLQGLVDHFDSVWLRQGAHHILHMLQNKYMLDPQMSQVLEALEGSEPSVQVAWAAERALEVRHGRNWL